MGENIAYNSRMGASSVDYIHNQWINSPRGCYELTQEGLANAGNEGSAMNQANRGIPIEMRFFSQVHNML